MQRQPGIREAGAVNRRKIRTGGKRRGVTAVLCCVSMMAALSGCVSSQQFRAAALPAVQSGTLSIVTGVVEGIFAALAVDPQNPQ